MQTITTWRIEAQNLKETMALLGSWQSGMARICAAALYGIAEEVMTASKDIVPVDTGALKSTGHVQPPRISGAVVEVTLGYGGVAGNGSEVDYAWFVHENLAAQHASPTQAKFLEEPLNARIKDIDKLLAAAITEMMNR